MGQVAGPAAAIAGAGLAAGSTLMKAEGTQAADEYQAAELERAAEYGKLKAAQTFGQLTQRLNQTLGNIDSIRMAAHNDPTSPTGAAYRDFQESVGENQRSIETNSLLAQARRQESDAAYLRWAGGQALIAGRLGAFGQFLGAAGPAGSNPSFGLPGGSGAENIPNPGR